MRLLFSSVLLVFSTALFAQTDSLRAEQLVSQAMGAIGRQRLDSVEIYHREARQIFEKNGWLAAWMRSFSAIAVAWGSTGNDPFRGMELLETGLKTLPRPPQNTAERERYCLLMMNAGYLCENLIGDFQGAKDWYERSYDYFNGDLARQSERVLKYLHRHLANVYSRLGDYDRAQNLLREAIEQLAQRGLPTGEEHSDWSIALNETGQHRAALAACQAGLKTPDLTPERQAFLRLEASVTWLHLGQPGEAAKANALLPGLLRSLEKSGNRNAQYLRVLHLKNTAEIAEKQGQWAAAAAHLSQAIALAAERNSGKRDIAKLLAQRANALLQSGKTRESLAENQAALRRLLKNFAPANDDENPAPELFYAENTLFEALEGKALAFEKLGKPEAALACYELIPRIEAKLRETYMYESSALRALRESRQRFDRAVQLAWQLFEKTGDRRFADRAFRLTEQARGLLLLQSLARAQHDYRLPSDLRRREANLKARIVWHEQQIAELKEADAQANAAQIRTHETALLQLKREQETLQQQLRRDFPAYAGLADEIKFVAAGEVPALLRPGQTMVNFYLTDSAAFVFFFAENGRFDWQKRDLPADFRQSVSGFAQYLTRPDETDAGRAQFAHTAAGLFDLLLRPVWDSPSAGGLVIIPDDVLAFLPFEILLTEPATVGWEALPYLLRQTAVAYAYSATLLREQQKIGAARRGASRFFAGFAPSYQQQQDTVLQKLIAERTRGGSYDLKGTHVEVRDIKGILGGDIFDGPPATEAQFKAVAEKYRVLHLAMHALANEQNPALSRLLFGDRRQNPDDPTDDNILYANELQIMRLQADLAVLSACHTGFGSWQKGEGVFSLARAFANAGVPATVMSLWRLPDGSAPALMRAFYQNLADGLPKDEALRHAKLGFLETDSLYYFAHPYFWAGVVANGDMRPLPKPASDGWLWLLGAAVLGGLLWWMWRRRQK